MDKEAEESQSGISVESELSHKEEEKTLKNAGLYQKKKTFWKKEKGKALLEDQTSTKRRRG